MKLVGQLAGAGGEDNPLGERPGDFELGVVDRVGKLLQRFLPHVGARHTAGYHDHGGRIEHGVTQSGHQVGEPRAYGGGNDRDPSASPEVGVGGVGGHLLVIHRYVVDAVAVLQGVHEGEVAVTYQPEYGAYFLTFQSADERCCAGYLSGMARDVLLWMR